MSKDPHALSELRSIEYHRKIGEYIQADPSILKIVKQRLHASLRGGDASRRHWASAWLKLIDGPIDILLRALVDPGESAKELRQSTPFTGILTPEERREIFNATNK